MNIKATECFEKAVNEANAFLINVVSEDPSTKILSSTPLLRDGGAGAIVWLDKTFADIYDAFTKGKSCIVCQKGVYAPVSLVNVNELMVLVSNWDNPFNAVTPTSYPSQSF